MERWLAWGTAGAVAAVLAACGSGGTARPDAGAADAVMDVPVDAPEVPSTDLSGDPGPDEPGAPDEGPADTDPADPGAADVPVDGTSAEDAPGEAADVPPDPACPPAPGGILDLFPGLPDTQIHAVAAFDGEAIWVAFTVPRGDGSSLFQTWAARLGCDGSALVPPFNVETSDRGNAIDPDIAVFDGKVVIAWQVDASWVGDGTADPNMLIPYRVFQVDGTPVMAQDRLVEPRLGGQPVKANAFLPRVAPLPGGGFVLAGSFGPPMEPPEDGRFQAFVQRFLASGDPVPAPGGGVPDLAYPFPEPRITQGYPAVAALPDGSLFLAWARGTDEANDRVVHARLAPDGTLDPSPPVEASPGVDSSYPALVTWPGEQPQALLAFQLDAGGDILVRPAVPAGEASSVLLGGIKVDHSPSLALGPGGAAVAWNRLRTGLRNDLLVRRVTFDGTTVAAPAPEVLVNPKETDNDHAAAPYGTTITHVGDGVFFTVWSEGTSPAFRLKGRFVKP